MPCEQAFYVIRSVIASLPLLVKFALSSLIQACRKSLADALFCSICYICCSRTVITNASAAVLDVKDITKSYHIFESSRNSNLLSKLVKADLHHARISTCYSSRMLCVGTSSYSRILVNPALTQTVVL